MTVGTGSTVHVDMGALPAGVDGYAFYAKGPADQLPKLIYVGTSRTFDFGPPPPAAPALALTNDDSHILDPGTYDYYVAAYVGEPRDGNYTVLSPKTTIVIGPEGNGVAITLPAVPTGYDGLLVWRVNSDGDFVLVGST